MKQFRVLFIMLTLVTFMTGFGKTTADLKQNSKTECVAFDVVKDAPAFSAIVVDFDFVANDSISFSGCDSTAIDFKPNCVTFNAIVTDVGWRYSQRNYKQLANTEKVMSLKDLYHKNKLKTNRIREDNPFSNSMQFYISNRSC